MKPLTLALTSLLAIGLAACDGAQEPTAPDMSANQSPMDMASPDGMDHGDHDMANASDGAMDGVGHAPGTIASIGSQGYSLTIAHGHFAGDIEMGAMTMGFDIMGDVDLSGFSAGDEVAIMVKQGRDGSYRIMAICNTAPDGADCLDAMMDH